MRHFLPKPVSLTLAVVCFAFLVGCGQQSFSEMANEMAGTSIPTVRASEIPVNAILLDAREAEEFAVSHIPGARPIGYKHFSPSDCADIPKDAEIVVYCSVGYRSSKVAEQLRDAGYTNVHNLWGGIFNWINNGYPVEDAMGPTLRIHPYNPEWGSWLTRGTRAYE
ncbi:MAG: rhodanese-like domain-containing protein [Flavobacteriales bacterium]|nr:rhodanese-like domain-containing protein [Flavobacteriales bacterium]